MKLSAEPGCTVKFAYEDGGTCEHQEVTFVVLDEHLWSAEGLARIFTECRDAYLGSDHEYERYTWRLISVEVDATGFLVVPEGHEPI